MFRQRALNTPGNRSVLDAVGDAVKGRVSGAVDAGRVATAAFNAAIGGYAKDGEAVPAGVPSAVPMPDRMKVDPKTINPGKWDNLFPGN